MAAEDVKLKDGENLLEEGQQPDRAFIVREGTVRLCRTIGEVQVPIALLGAGDVVFSDALFRSRPVNFTATASGRVEGTWVGFEDFSQATDYAEDWFSTWATHALLRQRIHEAPERSDVATLYSVCNLLYSFLGIVDTGRRDGMLRGPMRQVSTELRKNRPQSRLLIQPIVRGLSQVCLVDIREGDPMQPMLVIPDRKLYLGFLIFLQNAADFREGLHEKLYVVNPADLKPETELMLDALLGQQDLAQRVFKPERAVVHLGGDRIQEIYRRQGGEGTISRKHPAVMELEQHGVFNAVEDDIFTVFLNLREMMRLNIRRDPTMNFIDIIDYLLDSLQEERQQFLASLAEAPEDESEGD